MRKRLLLQFLLPALALLVLATGCAVKPKQKTPGTYEVFGQTYKVLDKADGYSEVGIASWYGEDFHGKKTSTGEIYDMYGRTCAHKTLPLGTHVRIRNIENGKEVKARVNDRGPFVDGRIVDLTLTLAKDLDMADKGLARVRVEPLGGVSFDTGPFTWQVGSFAERQNAEKLSQLLRIDFEPVRIVQAWVGNRTMYRVQVGRFDSKAEAEKQKDRFRNVCEKPWLVGFDG